jgi:hypothetical protein
VKIIISHDVDHLNYTEHILHDLYIPKLWIRSSFELLNGKIGFITFANRFRLLNGNRINRIIEIIEYDKLHNIPSTFFFGMSNDLGLSYKKNDASIWIKYILEKKFDVGVHGIDFNNEHRMGKEFRDFKEISGLDYFGIRTHYVRYDNSTFKKMETLGYLFDSSEFDKANVCLKGPYKIGSLWEFPLNLMDVYTIKGNLDFAKAQTIASMNHAIDDGLKYFTFLFHDHLFNEKTFPLYRSYYEWFIDYCENRHLKFISYMGAIVELENKPNLN